MFSSFLNPFQILDSSKLIEFADNNFRLDENGRKFSKRVESSVGKGEIARYEQFLLFLLCFQKTCTKTRKNQGLFGKGLIILSCKERQQPILYLSKSKTFTDNKLNSIQIMKFFEKGLKKLGKGENVAYQHFLLFCSVLNAFHQWLSSN